jgi:hypothetical protein
VTAPRAQTPLRPSRWVSSHVYKILQDDIRNAMQTNEMRCNERNAN